MENTIELELQLRITDKGVFDDLVCDPVFCSNTVGLPQKVIYETIYFDTADHRLQAKHYALRIRKSAGDFTATIKDESTTGAGLFTRNEWNKKVDSKIPSIDVFADLPIGKTLAEIIRQEPLLPLFTTLVKRTFVNISPEVGTVIELSADIGKIICPGKSEEICEIELELKKGRPFFLFKTAEELAGRFPLLPEKNSKFLRGLMLAGLADGNITEGEQKQKDFQFEKNSGPKKISEMLNKQLDEMIEMQGSFIQSPDKHGTVHQLRIIVRTFRSYLYVMKPVFDQNEYRTIQKAFRNYALGFSGIREYDVLMQTYDEFLLKNPNLARRSKSFVEWIQMKRSGEQSALLDGLAKGSFTQMFMKARGFLEYLGEQGENLKDIRIYSISRRRFIKNFKEFKLLFKNTDFTNPKAVHELRKMCKKLNYSLQLLNSGDKNKIIIGADLKKLQKALGELCDINIFIRIAGEFGQKGHAASMNAFIGYQAAMGDKLREKLLKIKP